MRSLPSPSVSWLQDAVCVLGCRLVSRRCHAISSLPSTWTPCRPPGVRHRTCDASTPDVSSTPHRAWRTSRSRARSSRVYHTSSPAPVRRSTSLDGASSRPHLAVTPVPFSSPAAALTPGTGTCTPFVLCHAWHTRVGDEPRGSRRRLQALVRWPSVPSAVWP